MGNFYDKMTTKAYDDFRLSINFSDPEYVKDVIAKEKPAEGDSEHNFGWLDAARDSKIFDIAQGTGIMGRLLSEEGFTHIDGADASPQFVLSA